MVAAFLKMQGAVVLEGLPAANIKAVPVKARPQAGTTGTTCLTSLLLLPGDILLGEVPYSSDVGAGNERAIASHGLPPPVVPSSRRTVPASSPFLKETTHASKRFTLIAPGRGDGLLQTLFLGHELLPILLGSDLLMKQFLRERKIKHHRWQGDTVFFLFRVFCAFYPGRAVQPSSSSHTWGIRNEPFVDSACVKGPRS